MDCSQPVRQLLPGTELAVETLCNNWFPGRSTALPAQEPAAETSAVVSRRTGHELHPLPGAAETKSLAVQVSQLGRVRATGLSGLPLHSLPVWLRLCRAKSLRFKPIQRDALPLTPLPSSGATPLINTLLQQGGQSPARALLSLLGCRRSTEARFNVSDDSTSRRQLCASASLRFKPIQRDALPSTPLPSSGATPLINTLLQQGGQSPARALLSLLGCRRSTEARCNVSNDSTSRRQLCASASLRFKPIQRCNDSPF